MSASDPKGMTDEQLDTWLAEHAMGWVWAYLDDYPNTRFLVPESNLNAWTCRAKGNERVSQTRGFKILKFSTDPSASAQLLDAMEVSRATRRIQWLTRSPTDRGALLSKSPP